MLSPEFVGGRPRCRAGLLTIIALGEGIVGTVASLSAEVTVEGWTVDAVLVAVAGIGLTFGMWWIYFVVPVGTVLTVAIPVGVYIGSIYLLFTLLVNEWDSFHTLLLVLTGAVLGGAVALAAAGVSMAVCLLIITLAPMVTILGFELVGHRHAVDVVNRRLAEGAL